MVRRASAVAPDGDALFVKDGVPVKFCFHRSVTQGQRRITRDVERHGGQIVPDERHANVLLVDEQEDLAFLRRRYYSSTELYRLSLYVEPRGFVQRCIHLGSYAHVRPVKQGMPGRPPGGGRGKRVPFTEEDKDDLAFYIATRCPTRDGRMGNSAYKDLERLGQTSDPAWAWARRHTFHSWREHYKMNPVMMDARIDLYLEQLKDVGHHLGHDPRRHNHRELRQEEEEGDDENNEEDQGQGIRRPGSARREPQQVRPRAAAREAQDYPTRHEQLQAKRRRRIQSDARHQRDVRGAHAKRPRKLDSSPDKGRTPNDEAQRGESVPARENESDGELSQEIEGSDLFGDQEYEESRFEFDDFLEIDFPKPFSPRASPVPERDGAPPSTQATLVASPLARQKGGESRPAPDSMSVSAVEAEASAPEPIAPPGPEVRMVAAQERVVVRSVRVRGASVQPGQSVPETRMRGDIAVVEVPYQNTQARLRSVEAQPQPAAEFRSPRQRDHKGKGRATEEDKRVAEGSSQREADADEPVVVTGRLSMRETFEDEVAVEELLQASVEVVEEGREHEGEDWDDVISDEDEDIMPPLSRFQDVEIEIESDPTDSDDAETHEVLLRGAALGAAGEGGVDVAFEQRPDQHGDLDVGDGSVDGSEFKPQPEDQDQGDDEDGGDDADTTRIERMATRSLRATPAPASLQPKVTRSKAATQIRLRPEFSPRRTRSGRTRVS